MSSSTTAFPETKQDQRQGLSTPHFNVNFNSTSVIGGTTTTTTIKNNNKNNSDDFEMQMKSLQERRAAADYSKHSSSSSSRSPHTKKATKIQLAPASFIIDDKLKSTQRLVQEATNKMEEPTWSSWGTSGSGGGMTRFAPTAQQQQQLLSTLSTTTTRTTTTPIINISTRQPRMAWTDESPPLDTAEADSNPYAALQEEDDDHDNHDYQDNIDEDDYHASRRTTPKLQQFFHFAPPSFQIHGGDNSNDNGDWDPDL